MELLFDYLSFQKESTIGSLFLWGTVLFLTHVYFFYILSWITRIVVTNFLIVKEVYEENIKDTDQMYKEDHNNSH